MCEFYAVKNYVKGREDDLVLITPKVCDDAVKPTIESDIDMCIEKQNIPKLICSMLHIDDIGLFSDGYHTFNSLYEQRLILFATLVNTYPDISWKSFRHEDGELCFGGGWFIVGIDTPEGSYTYHYEEKYWDYFKCQVLENAKKWDGHTDKDVSRLLSLKKSDTKEDYI